MRRADADGARKFVSSASKKVITNAAPNSRLRQGGQQTKQKQNGAQNASLFYAVYCSEIVLSRWTVSVNSLQYCNLSYASDTSKRNYKNGTSLANIICQRILLYHRAWVGRIVDFKANMQLRRRYAVVLRWKRFSISKVFKRKQWLLNDIPNFCVDLWMCGLIISRKVWNWMLQDGSGRFWKVGRGW